MNRANAAACILAALIGLLLALPVSASTPLEELPVDYVPYYPPAATKSLSNIATDLSRLSSVPEFDDRRLWEIQWELLTIAQALFGKLDDSVTIGQPEFAADGPFIVNYPGYNNANAMLSYKALDSWPTVVYELAYETVHLLNPTADPRNMLAEGVAVAFTMYAQHLYGLDIQLPDDQPHIKALSLVASLPDDALVSASRIRREIGQFNDVTQQDLLDLYPDLDGEIAFELTRPFIAESKPRKAAPITRPISREYAYPATATRHADFAATELIGLVDAPEDDPQAMWQVQLELLTLAEDIFGPRNPKFQLRAPQFRETGPTIRFSVDRKSVATELSDYGRQHWPTIVFEMSHETVHLIDPVVGNANYLEEGAAVAFSLHAQSVYGLVVYVPPDAPYVCALDMLHELPGDALEAAGRIRRETGPLSEVETEDLLALFPDLDRRYAEILTSRFSVRRDPCETFTATRAGLNVVRDPRYPTVAARQSRFELMDIYSLVDAPIDDPEMMLKVQEELLTLTEDIFGPRNPDYQLLEPRFYEFGPTYTFSGDGKSVWIDLGLNGQFYWPTIVYEMGHSLLLTFDGPGLPTYLMEGASMAFALHAQQLYGLEVWEPLPEEPWACALELVNELPGDALEAAGRLRREVGSLRKVKVADLLDRFPSLDPGTAESLTRRFDFRSNPCDARSD